MADKLVFKEDQQKAIDHQGDLVLTASAGTGKTTILVEKFANTLINELENDSPGAVLGSMVAITFTDMAAAELKSRIRERLFEEIESPGNSESKRLNLNRTIRDLDGAYIGTIHSFCKRILIENFLEAEVNPGFAILDEQEAEDLRNQSAEKAVFKSFTPDTDHLKSLIASVGISSFKNEIIGLGSKLRSDGYEDFDPESLIAEFRGHHPEAMPIIKKALDLIIEIKEAYALFNAGKPTDSTLKAEQKIAQGVEAMQKVHDNYDKFYDTPLPEILLSTKISPRPNNTKLKYIKDVSLEFRRLVGKETSLDFTLLDLADLNSSFPLMADILAIVKDYQEIYSREKSRLDSYDFDDLLLKSRNLLKNNPMVLKHYHEKFKHLYVDEFQDVNAVQMEIVQLLRGFDEDSNGRTLFLVGDSKQSIYKFRSADVMRFESFVDSIEKAGGANLQLKSNFRSTAVLIDVFNKLFERMFEKEQVNKYQTTYQELEAGLTENSSEKTSVDIIEMTNTEARYEAQRIAWKIHELLQNPEENISPGDIAILLRTTTKLSELETEFKRANIPYRVIGGKGFYLQREIWDVAVYLKTLWFPEDNYATVALLRSPLCALSDQTLFDLSLNGLLKSETIFSEENSKHIADKDERERFLALTGLINDQRTKLDTISTAEIIAQLLQVSGYESLLLATVGGDQGAANLRKLIELARNYESKGVESGLEFTLDLFSRIFTDTNEQQATLAGDDHGTIKVMTVHKSKGLQFPVVFLPFTHSKLKSSSELILYESKYGPGIKHYNPESGKAEAGAYYNMVKKVKDLQDEAEMLRLFYVAATRAKKKLIITAPEKANKGSWKQRIVNLGLGEEGFEDLYGIRFYRDEEIMPTSHSTSPLYERLSSQPPAKIKAVEDLLASSKSSIELRRKKINCGVWELINLVYPKDDLPEYLASVIKEEQDNNNEGEAPVSATEAGTVIHELLENHNFSSPVDKEDLQEKLAKTSLSKAQQQEASSFLENWLSSELALELGKATKLMRETPFSLSLKKEDVVVTVNGIIDLVVERQDGTLWLLDYKYAISKESPEYDLQMQIYSMVIEKAFGKLPEKSSLVYLKDGNNFEVNISQSSLDRARSLIWNCILPGVSQSGDMTQTSLF
jgi:ATP-dependent helicase/nuclease subunit A